MLISASKSLVVAVFLSFFGLFAFSPYCSYQVSLQFLKEFQCQLNYFKRYQIAAVSSLSSLAFLTIPHVPTPIVPIVLHLPHTIFDHPYVLAYGDVKLASE